MIPDKDPHGALVECTKPIAEYLSKYNVGSKGGQEIMRRKKCLFHVTKPQYVEDIIKNGLRRSMGARTTCCVYLSEKPLSWYKPGLEILRVDITGLSEIKANTWLTDSDEVMFWGDIPAWKLTKDGFKPRITCVTDKYVKRR